jgi:hypothetical protein
VRGAVAQDVEWGLLVRLAIVGHGEPPGTGPR